MLTDIPIVTSAAPQLPATIRIASTVGLSASAIVVAGRTYCIAAFVSIYSTPTMATPPISASGRLRWGFFTSPAIWLTSDQPS